MDSQHSSSTLLHGSSAAIYPTTYSTVNKPVISPKTATSSPAATATTTALSSIKKRKRVGSMPAAEVTPYVAYEYLLPKKLLEWEPTAVSLHHLMEFERRLDALLSRKRCDYQEVIKRPMKLKKTLQIYLYHYAVNEHSPPSHVTNHRNTETTSAEVTKVDGSGYSLPPSFTFYIEGHLLEAQTPPLKRFSELLRSLRIGLKRHSDDTAAAAEVDMVEWIKGKDQGTTKDGFEVKRRCVTHRDVIDIQVLLQLDHVPEMFRLSEEMRSLLGGLSAETRMGTAIALWNYIKTHRLQDEDDRKLIIADEALQRVLGVDRLTFSQLPTFLDSHLLPLEPIELTYCVKMEEVSTPDQPKMAVYNMEVEVEDPLRSMMQHFTVSTESASGLLLKDLSEWDRKFIELLYEIRQSCIKREFMQSFAIQPVEFINQWVSSQAHDLKTILGEGDSMSELTLHMEDWRTNSQLFQQDWAREAVYYYLHSKSYHALQEWMMQRK
jgi:SWI/SNF-related matrix-associated actin-dependent regulator of chromatin subfamily D